MTSATILSQRDIGILEKIKDPESNPSMAVLVDKTLPKDPNILDQVVYDQVSKREREIVITMQQLEFEMAGLRPKQTSDPIGAYRSCVSDLSDLIAKQPDYASARNNRAQALRRLYGDCMLLAGAGLHAGSLIQNADESEKMAASATALSDLDRCISLLSPRSIFAAVGPLTARTLSLAHTQRAAIYHATSKGLGSGAVRISSDRKEEKWTALEFEEAASRDFALGGRYGNDIAKGLAVSTNPTAKLCGEMVREMMKKEYGPGLA